MDLFLRQQGIRGGYWLAQTTLLSGLKLNYWQISGTWTPRVLFGKILSLGLGSPTPLSLIMVFNLIAKPSGDTVMTWALRIGSTLAYP